MLVRRVQLSAAAVYGGATDDRQSLLSFYCRITGAVTRGLTFVHGVLIATGEWTDTSLVCSYVGWGDWSVGQADFA